MCNSTYLGMYPLFIIFQCWLSLSAYFWRTAGKMDCPISLAKIVTSIVFRKGFVMIFLGQILLIDGILSRVWVRPPLCLLLARVPSRKIQNQIFNFEIYLIFWIWSSTTNPTPPDWGDPITNLCVNSSCWRGYKLSTLLLGGLNDLVRVCTMVFDQDSPLIFSHTLPTVTTSLTSLP